MRGLLTSILHLDFTLLVKQILHSFHFLAKLAH